MNSKKCSWARGGDNAYIEYSISIEGRECPFEGKFVPNQQIYRMPQALVFYRDLCPRKENGHPLLISPIIWFLLVRKWTPWRAKTNVVPAWHALG